MSTPAGTFFIDGVAFWAPTLPGWSIARAAFRGYGVSGTPTFVLIDGNGIVREHATGYAKKKGLAIEGWKWDAGATASGG